MIVSFLIYFNSSLMFGKTNNRIWQARNARDMLSSSKAKQSRVSRTLVEECKKRPEIFASYAYLEFRHRLRDTSRGCHHPMSLAPTSEQHVKLFVYNSHPFARAAAL